MAKDAIYMTSVIDLTKNELNFICIQSNLLRYETFEIEN